MKGQVVPRLIALLAAFMLVVPAPADASVATDRYEHRVLHRINQAREPNLRHSACAERYALAHVRALKGKPYGSLYHPGLTSALYRCNAYRAGEVIGRTTFGPRALVRAWLTKSPDHRAVIMRKKYRRAGVAVIRDGDRWLVSVVFLQPM